MNKEFAIKIVKVVASYANSTFTADICENIVADLLPVFHDAGLSDAEINEAVKAYNEAADKS